MIKVFYISYQQRQRLAINPGLVRFIDMDQLPQLRHRHVNQPLAINATLQPRRKQRSVPIMHNLLRHCLSHARPRRLHCYLAPVQQAEIVPNIEIPWLEHQLQLMRVHA